MGMSDVLDVIFFDEHDASFDLEVCKKGTPSLCFLRRG
jgi:hypothetical protein